MRANVNKYLPFFILVGAIFFLGINALVAWAIVTATVGAPHANSAAFERDCTAAHGQLFESRASGICISKDGKILFTTGTGGFTSYK
jgi:hypothetical protein